MLVFIRLNGFFGFDISKNGTIQSMLRILISFLLLAACLMFCQAAVAAPMTLQETLKQMADLLAEQQKELDAQRKELAEQRELIRQLQGDKSADSEPAPAPVKKSPTESVEAAVAQQSGAATAETDPDTDTGEDQSAQDQAKEALAKQQTEAPETPAERVAELQKSMDDPANTIYDEDFPGAWYMPGTTAAMKIGGYVNLSLVNSFDPMVISDRFIVGSIPPDGTTVPTAQEGTTVTANQSRVNLEYREQTNLGEIRAFVEGDFRGNGDSFRLRHAFGQFRTVLAGKTWSTLMDIDSRPEEVDIEGINGQILLRHSQIRWTPHFGEKWNLKLALEDPETDVINGQDDRGRFDLVASLNRMPLGPLGRWNYRVGLVLRDLKATGAIDDPDDVNATNATAESDSTTGWGITTGGSQPVKWWGGKDYIYWQVAYGEGIGHYINDLETVGGGDAVFDPEGRIHALPVFSGYLSYQHYWPMTWTYLKGWPGILRSNMTVSWVDINNFEFQDGDDYNRTLRASVNLMYSPTHNVTTGVEFLWGKRTNKDKSEGTATQLQFSARYNF